MVGVEAYQAGTFGLLPYDADLQKAYGSMMAPLRRNLRRVTLDTGSRHVIVTADRVGTVLSGPQVDAVSMGRYSGYIDAINVHADPVFYLYPVIGPTRISCVFDRTLLDEVKNALKQYTTVRGLMDYSENSPFPTRITVESIEINPPAADLPTLGDLRGIAPTLTEGLDSVEYVRQQRHAAE